MLARAVHVVGHRGRGHGNHQRGNTMAKQRKSAATLGAELTQATQPAAPVAAAPTQTTLYVMGKRYRVKEGTKHAHDQHWALICAALVDGPQPLADLAALGTTVHATNAMPYARYCVRRGWLVPAQA